MLDRDGWAGLTLVLFSIGGFFVTSQIPVPLTAELGPAFFPRLLFGLLLICGVVLVAQSVRAEEKAPLPKENWLIVISMVTLVLGYAFLLKSLGFVVSSLLFMLLSMLVLGVRNYIYLFAVPVSLSFGLYWLFVSVFRIVLP